MVAHLQVLTTINILSANDIIDKNMRDLKIIYGIDNIPIENHRLPYIWMPKVHKNLIKARFKKRLLCLLQNL